MRSLLYKCIFFVNILVGQNQSHLVFTLCEAAVAGADHDYVGVEKSPVMRQDSVGVKANSSLMLCWQELDGVVGVAEAALFVQCVREEVARLHHFDDLAAGLLDEPDVAEPHVRL